MKQMIPKWIIKNLFMAALLFGVLALLAKLMLKLNSN